MSAAVIQMLVKNKIAVMVRPVYSSDRLQPLDVSVLAISRKQQTNLSMSVQSDKETALQMVQCSVPKTCCHTLFMYKVVQRLLKTLYPALRSLRYFLQTQAW